MLLNKLVRKSNKRKNKKNNKKKLLSLKIKKIYQLIIFKEIINRFI